MTKRCPRCNLILDESLYNWKIKGKQLAAYCKECSRAYVKSHYDRHVSYYVNKAKRRNSVVRKMLHAYVAEYLRTHPCVDCGEKDIVVLEFDHKDRTQKNREIAIMMKSMLSMKTLTKEIEKCDVRCANCHHRKTARENGNWKLNLLP